MQILFAVSQEDMRPAPPWPLIWEYGTPDGLPPQEIQLVIERAWTRNPDDRPSASQLLGDLRSLSSRIGRNANANRVSSNDVLHKRIYLGAKPRAFVPSQSGRAGPSARAEEEEEEPPVRNPLVTHGQEAGVTRLTGGDLYEMVSLPSK